MDLQSRAWRRWALLVAGWAFVVLGVAGLFLPFLQGVLFLFVGIALLSLASPRVRLLRIRLGARFPAFRAAEEQARTWMRDRWRRLRQGPAKTAPDDPPPSSGS
ncbi:MAG: PGPGW domain-containing protein [Rhodospirillales bacterium]|jgi:hypothetical protein|nr:PGPGW domain-containing protein [Rhodospirillales bacterium]